jgi:hypothetical protein
MNEIGNAGNLGGYHRDLHCHRLKNNIGQSLAKGGE